MIFMKYSSNSVNALSLADIDKLENSILELEKYRIAKEMIIRLTIVKITWYHFGHWIYRSKANDHDADHMIGIHDDEHHLGEWDDEGRKAELIQEANAGEVSTIYSFNVVSVILLRVSIWGCKKLMMRPYDMPW